jgi:hypothetical protein
LSSQPDDLSIFTLEELRELRASAESAFKEVYRTVVGLPEAEWPAARLLHLAQLRQRMQRFDETIGLAEGQAQPGGGGVAADALAEPTSAAHPAAGEVRCFISYAHEDENMRRELVKHLALLRRVGALVVWDDRGILPAEEWARKLDEWLDSSDLVIALISPDFMASDYCYKVELPRALERSKLGKTRLIPVLCRPAVWKSESLSRLQVLPTGARPISEWPNTDLAWVDVATGIMRTVAAIQAGPGRR